MKRWIVLLGRVGTTLIAIGCAILLVSLIPSAPFKSFQSHGRIEGKTWTIPCYERLSTSQEELSISITANDTIKAYLLKVSIQTIIEWINEKISMEPTADPMRFRQETYLLEYLEANPQVKAMEKTLNGKTTLEYISTKITNITLILHNPNPNLVEFSIEGYIFRTMAPKVKMQSISQITIPLGFVLAVLWIATSLKVKRKVAKLNDNRIRLQVREEKFQNNVMKYG